jgi:magnesium chelatase subunit H
MATGSLRFVVVTMNGHLLGALERAGRKAADAGVDLRVHVAADWGTDPEALDACRRDLETAELVLVSQLFLEEHATAVRDVLEENRDRYRALVCILSEGELVHLTRMGKLDMSSGGDEKRSKWHPLSVLKRLKGERKSGGTSGKRQMMVLRTVPKILRFLPGAAQDLRAYMLTLQAWLSGSQPNLLALLLLLADRYGELDTGRDVPELRRYPDEGLYHPSLRGGRGTPQGITERLDELPAPAEPVGTVGLLIMRSYVLAGNTAHYDAVIHALEGRGLRVIPAFAAGLDNRSVVARYFQGAGGSSSFGGSAGRVRGTDTDVRKTNGSVEGPDAGVRTPNGGVNEPDTGITETHASPRSHAPGTGPAGSASGIDAVASLTGFSLVGGPAYNDAASARTMLEELDVPCLTLVPLEFQTVEEWEEDDRGLNPLQTALMVSVPELDGSVAPHVFGGRVAGADGPARDTSPVPERVERVAERLLHMVRLRRRERAERKLAVVLFNFPPNAGAVGSAAYLDVWASLHRTLEHLASQGYSVDVPESPDVLRDAVLGGNAERWGTPAHVAARTPVDDYLREARWLDEIEAVWGAAPGRELTDGRSLFVLGARMGNVFVGVQPPFGIEGDPMRLLFEGGYAPTHAFANFYRWLQKDFGADAYLHFGTHGALEFLPGKHVGMSAACWPDRLLGDVPNFYLYAANNPSEGTLAKRRTAATLVTYLTPSVTQAGLYRGLLELRANLDRLAGLDPAEDADERASLVEAVAARCEDLDLAFEGEDDLPSLRGRLLEMEYALIPHGLHVLGESAGPEERADVLLAVARAGRPERDLEPLDEMLGAGATGNGASGHGREQAATHQHEAGGAAANGPAADAIRTLVADGPRAGRRALESLGLARDVAGRLADYLHETDAALQRNGELDGLVRALDGRFVPPTPGGDLIRQPEVLPTGRNLYAFDPYRIPSPAAMAEGRRLVDALLERAGGDGPLPETVAMVLWGTDNMKRDGAPVAQALALLGAEPRFDSYGRLAGARLVPLEELGRPRIDVVMTTSGVFRDLLPLQLKLLAEAVRMAALADEPDEDNYVRTHARAQAEALGCSLEDAALRVFSNAQGAYGANVNLMVDRSVWEEEDALADAFLKRKSFAYGADGQARANPALLERALEGVGFTFQNLDSVELGVTDVDQYFDSLGGLTRLATRNAGRDVPAYIGDETRGSARVRSLEEQVELEARTRILNPRWYEGMLGHGYQGVRELENRVTAAVGWSATTGTVPEWVYQRVGETFVLDPEMRERLSELNPHATAGMAARLVEAVDRGYWAPDDETLDELHEITDELEDRMEGIEPEYAA